MKSGHIGLSLVLLAGTVLYAPEALADRRFRCESSDHRQVWCEADTRHGVRLLTQYSRAPCYQGDTWGYSRRGVWVSNGCRAEFEIEERRSSSDNGAAVALIGLALIGAAIAEDRRDDRRDRHNESRYPGYGPSNLVRCESHDRRQSYCPLNTRGARINVQRQLSNANCSYGYSWGYDRRGIWVSNGCRADFAVYY